jgi:molecular chaperone DnaK
MAKSIGIDLGTTNSVVAIVKGSSASILRNPESGELTRSVVSKIPKNPDLLVGDVAYDFGLELSPENTIRSIKRLIGRDYVDPNVQRMKDTYSFRIIKPSQGTERSVAVVLDNHEYSPEEISAMILGKLRSVAVEELQDEELTAVITVPAYFNDKQKEATRRAGWLAGLKVKRVLAEPTAAAISYGMDEVDPKEARTILVYDLGGGTFDVSILLIAGGAFVERAKGGDMWLGGDDFDQKIIDFILQKTSEEHILDDVKKLISRMEKSSKDAFLCKLLRAAEEAKKKLSSLQSARVFLPAFLKDEDGMDIPINVEITRAQFESMIAPQIERTIAIVNATIREAGLTVGDVDKILLIGGSTLIPLVAQRLTDEFGKGKVLRSGKPMLAVAEGAAILANRLGEKIECPNNKCGREIIQNVEKCPYCGFDLTQSGMTISAILPHDYAIQVLEMSDPGGLKSETTFVKVFKKGDPIPNRRKEVVRTSIENQRLYKIALFNIIDGKEIEVATLWGSLPEGMPLGTQIAIELSVAEDEQLDLFISIPSRSDYEVRKHIARGQTDEVFYMDFDDLIKKFARSENKLRPEEIRDFWVKAEDFVNEVNKGSVSRANATIMSMKKKLGEEYEDTEWERRADLYLSYGGYILGRYNGILTPDESYEYRRLLEQLKEEVIKRNKDMCTELCNQIDKYEGELRSWVWPIENVFVAARKIGPASPSKAAQLEQEGSALVSDAKAGKFDAVKQRLDKIWPEVKTILEAAADTGKEFLLHK